MSRFCASFFSLEYEGPSAQVCFQMSGVIIVSERSMYVVSEADSGLWLLSQG